MNVEILDDAEALAQRAADELEAVFARAPVADDDLIRVALSGGDGQRRLFEVLAERQTIAWDRVALYQVDERLAPHGHSDRNLTMLEDVLLSKVRPAEVHRMPVDDLGSYDVPVLDLVQLGLGADGHTASLIAGDPAVNVTDRQVSLSGVYEGRRRMTLTIPTIDRARRRLWVVSGAEKADALRLLLRADRSIPASRISRERTLVLVDRAAAAA